jgi:hypothetical protein
VIRSEDGQQPQHGLWRRETKLVPSWIRPKYDFVMGAMKKICLGNTITYAYLPVKERTTTKIAGVHFI